MSAASERSQGAPTTLLLALLFLTSGVIAAPAVSARTNHLSFGSASCGNLNVSSGTVTVASSCSASGTITVSGYGRLVFQGSTSPITINEVGDLHVQNHASLYINDTDLNFLQSYNHEFNLHADASARLSINAGSDIESAGWWMDGQFDGNSNTTMTDSTWGTTGGVEASIRGNANFTVIGSFLEADVTPWVFPGQPDTSTTRIVDSSGFNIIPNVDAGVVANLTFPASSPQNHTYSWANWTFPGTQPVVGIQYHIILVDDQVWRFGIRVWNGAHITIYNTTNLQLGFWTSGTTDVFGGFRDHWYGQFTYSTVDFYLHLSNVSMYTWGFFPDYSAKAYVNNSDVGQVITYTNSSAYLDDDNYTGITGFLEASNASSILVENTPVHSLALAQGNSSLELVNCTVYPGAGNPLNLRVQSVGDSEVDLVDVTVGRANRTSDLQATGGSDIRIEHDLTLNTFVSGAPLAGVPFTVVWTSNGTTAATGVTNGTGSSTAPLGQLLLTASGPPQWIENYTVTAGPTGDQATAGVTIYTAILLNLSLPSTPPLSVGLAASPGSGALPLLVNFTATAVGGTSKYSSYAWTFGDGATATSAAPVLAHTYSTVGSFSASVTVTDSQSNTATSSPVTVIVSWPKLSVSLATNLTRGPPPLQVSFTASASGGSSVYTGYFWTFGDGTTASTSGPTTHHTYQSAGSFSATVKVTDSTGTFTVSSPVVITPGWPPLSVTLSTNVSSGTLPLPVLLTASPVGGSSSYGSYAWTFGDGTTSTTTVPQVSHTYASAGSFSATVGVTDAVTGSNATSGPVTIRVFYAPLGVSITSAPAAPRAGFPVNFTAVPTGGSGSYREFFWNFGDSNTQTTVGATVSHTYEQAGNYSATVAVTDAVTGEYVVSSAEIVAVVPYSPPPALAVVISASPTTGVGPLLVSFTATASGGNGAYASYLWRFGDGISDTNGVTTNLPHVEYNYTDEGTFIANVTVTDGNATARSPSILITVSAPSTTGPPNHASRTATSSLLANPLLWVGLVVAAATATIVGLFALRKRRRGPPPGPGGERPADPETTAQPKESSPGLGPGRAADPAESDAMD